MLLLAAENPFGDQLYPIDFSWLEAPDYLTDPNFPDIVNSRLYSEEEVTKKLETVQKRLRSLTKGLLEVVQDTKDNPVSDAPVPCFHGQAVQFFHRTARDYILESPGWRQALRESFPDSTRRIPTHDFDLQNTHESSSIHVLVGQIAQSMTSNMSSYPIFKI
jgi:hypothetical protein